MTCPWMVLWLSSPCQFVKVKATMLKFPIPDDLPDLEDLVPIEGKVSTNLFHIGA